MKNVVRPQDIPNEQQQYSGATTLPGERGEAGQRTAWQQPHEKTAIGGVAVIQLGVIQAVLPYGRTYRVALQDNRILVCTHAADTSAHLVFGVDDCTALLPGTMVWVVHEPGSTTGTILAVQPSTVDEYGSYVPLDTVCGSNVGIVDDTWQTGIRQAFTERRALPAWKGFRLDATPGEWGKCTRTGGMISLDPMLAVLQVNPFCGVSAHLPGLFLRLCGGSYALFTKHSEEIVIGRLYKRTNGDQEQPPYDVYWDYGSWGITIPRIEATSEERSGKRHWYDLTGSPLTADYMWRWRGTMGGGFQWWTVHSSYTPTSMLALSQHGWGLLRGANGVLISSGALRAPQRKYALDEQQGDHEKDAKRFQSLEGGFSTGSPYYPTEVWDVHNRLFNWCIPAGQYAFPDKFQFATTRITSHFDGKVCVTPTAVVIDVAGNGITVDPNGVRITGRSVTIDCGNVLQLVGKRILLGACDMIQGRADRLIHWYIEREGGGGGGTGEEPFENRVDLFLHFNGRKGNVSAVPRYKAPNIVVRKLVIEECEAQTYVDEQVPYPYPLVVPFPAWGFLQGPTPFPSSDWLAVVAITPPRSITPQFDVTPMEALGLEGLRALDHSVIPVFDAVEITWPVNQTEYPFW